MPVIAVDGPAASGKGTIARRLASHYGFSYLDTGKIYRAVGFAVLEEDADPADEAAGLKAVQQLDPAQFENPILGSDVVASAASKVAAIGSVRAALKEFQVSFAEQEPGSVLDGRDIGTVICPTAPAKLFITASVEVRADRRHKELLSRGETSIYARVLQDLRDRDERDTSRTSAPLRPADDAVVIDTSDLTIDEVVAKAVMVVDQRIS